MSTQETLLLEMATDKGTATYIENALQNAGIPHTVESQAPFRVRVLPHVSVVAVLLTVLQEKSTAITGKATLPDGSVFELDIDGLNAMKQRLLSRLSMTPAANTQAMPSQSGIGLLDLVNQALKNPEATGRLVQEVANALRGSPEVALEERKQESRFTLAIIGLMAAVIIGVSLLGYVGRLSGDTVGLVYGTVIGSSFAFLYKYVATAGEEE